MANTKGAEPKLTKNGLLKTKIMRYRFVVNDERPPKKNNEPAKEPLVEGRDFTIDPQTGLMILTADYLLRRGYCCGSGCRNCPYPKK